MNRLFVTSLKSIGLVHAGDNPGSEVQIWKSHTEREVSDLMSGPILGEPGSSHTSTATSTTATVDQRIASMDQRLADMNRRLADLNRRIARLKQKRKERLARLANIPKKRNPMTMTDKEPQELNEMVTDKLTAYATREQYEGEIKGRYGYLSTPRQEMIIKIRSKWWDTPDGQAVRDLLRERGGDPAADLTTIAKSHSEAYAAIGRLDG